MYGLWKKNQISFFVARFHDESFQHAYTTIGNNQTKKKYERSVLTIPSRIERIERRQNAENMPLYFNFKRFDSKIKSYAVHTCGT